MTLMAAVKPAITLVYGHTAFSEFKLEAVDRATGSKDSRSVLDFCFRTPWDLVMMVLMQGRI